jgi:hypothetical protein
MLMRPKNPKQHGFVCNTWVSSGWYTALAHVWEGSMFRENTTLTGQLHTSEDVTSETIWMTFGMSRDPDYVINWSTFFCINSAVFCLAKSECCILPYLATAALK